MPRRLTLPEIEALAARPGARRIAVENVLISIPLNIPHEYQLVNIGIDARSYSWNSQTVRAIEDGLNMMYGPKGDHCPNCSTGYIDFTCPAHPKLRRYGKNIFYRGLFFAGPGLECECAVALLFHRCPVDGKTYRLGREIPDPNAGPTGVPPEEIA